MSSEIVGAAPAAPTYTDLSLEECLDERSNVIAYLHENEPKIAAARHAIAELDTMIELRMEETKSRKFERGGYRGAYVKQKFGSASVTDPAALRAALMRISDVPQKDIDKALPIVDVEPVVKPYLRDIRKIADYCKAAADTITAFIREPIEREVLVIEPIQIDVTPATENLPA